MLLYLLSTQIGCLRVAVNLKVNFKKKWRTCLDFVNLITTMPSRHSGDQVHKVDIFPRCAIKVWKGIKKRGVQELGHPVSVDTVY